MRRSTLFVLAPCISATFFSFDHAAKSSAISASSFWKRVGGGALLDRDVHCSASGGGSASASSSSGGTCNQGPGTGTGTGTGTGAGIVNNTSSGTGTGTGAGLTLSQIENAFNGDPFGTNFNIPPIPFDSSASTQSGGDCSASGTGTVSVTNVNGKCVVSRDLESSTTTDPEAEIGDRKRMLGSGEDDGAATGTGTSSSSSCLEETGAAGSQPQCTSSRIMTRALLQGRQQQPNPQSGSGGGAYLASINQIRKNFCLTPYEWNADLEANAAAQGGVTQGVPDGAHMKEDPCPGSAQVMAGGTGPDSIDLAAEIWACEVPTKNVPGCTCAQAWQEYSFRWTERGHFDLLVGPHAQDYTQIGCAFTPLTATDVNVPSALHGLWTCTLGNAGYSNCKVSS